MPVQYRYTWGPFITCVNFIPTRISNHMSGYVRDEITYPFPNFNGCSIEVRGRISNLPTHTRIDLLRNLILMKPWPIKLITLIYYIYPVKMRNMILVQDRIDMLQQSNNNRMLYNVWCCKHFSCKDEIHLHHVSTNPWQDSFWIYGSNFVESFHGHYEISHCLYDLFP